MSAARILPREEWTRLDAECSDFCETVAPEDVAVVVVEEGGAIVARMVVLRRPQLEGFWMRPDKIGNAGITRALLRAAFAKAGEWAPHWVVANADTSGPMQKTLERLGGQWMPVHTFMVPLQRVEMGDSCRLP